MSENTASRIAAFQKIVETLKPVLEAFPTAFEPGAATPSEAVLEELKAAEQELKALKNKALPLKLPGGECAQLGGEDVDDLMLSLEDLIGAANPSGCSCCTAAPEVIQNIAEQTLMQVNKILAQKYERIRWSGLDRDGPELYLM